jgi:hypothetical protein
MTYADMIAEALRLLHANANEPLTARLAAAINGVGEEDRARTLREATDEWIRAMSEDENYKDYIDGVFGALDRCFTDIELRGILSLGRAAIPEGGEAFGSYRRYAVAELIPSGAVPVAVEVSNPWGKPERLSMGVEYFIEAGELLLPAECEGAAILYRAALPRVTLAEDLSAVVPLPAQIASLVPYFLAAELYRGEEPGEAAELLSLYERGMTRAAALVSPVQDRVINVMSIDFGG